MRDACCGDGGSVTAVTSKNVKRRAPFGGAPLRGGGKPTIFFLRKKLFLSKYRPQIFTTSMVYLPIFSNSCAVFFLMRREFSDKTAFYGI